jgi:RimJ/RimL family protein N-acetyltransferase
MRIKGAIYPNILGPGLHRRFGVPTCPVLCRAFAVGIVPGVLKGKQINFRMLRRQEIPGYLEQFNDLERRGPFFPMMLIPEPMMEQGFEKDGHWSEERMLGVIADKTTDRPLGMVIAFKPVMYYNAYEFGYWLFDLESRGKGYVPEAVELFTAYLFRAKPIFRLQLQIEAGNAPSVRVAEKCGFKFEGTTRAAFIRDGRPADIGMYSLTREDWESRVH